jgi:acetyltransferase-like isoleucine patch superfamily enzyme
MNSSSFKLKELLEAMPECGRDLILWMQGDHGLLEEPVTGARTPYLAAETDVTFWKADRIGTMKSLSRVRIVEGESPDDPFETEDGVFYITTPRPRLLLAYLMQPFLASRLGTFWFRGTSDHKALWAISIGERTWMGGHVVLANCVIGDDCTIWHNVTIGGDGFSFEVDERNGNVVKLPHFGRVIIGDRVEIQSGTQIARGSLGDTIIEDDVKIDQLVHIAHNCHVKKGTLIPAGAMLAGSVTVGEYSWIAPETAIMNGATLGRCSMTGLGAVVTKDVGDNELVIGVPARKLRDRFQKGHPLLGGE